MTNKPLVSNSSDGKHELKFFESSHRYYLDGVSVKSATGVGNAYPKGDALTNWKIEQGIISALKTVWKNFRETEMHDDFNINIEALVKDHKLAYTKIAKQAAGLGTLVHDYLYNLDIGDEAGAKAAYQLGQAHPDVKLFNHAIDSANKYRDTNTDKLLLAEAIVASPTRMVAGKFDLLVDRKGMGNGIKDYKTSKGIHIDQFQQCATYDFMVWEWMQTRVSFWEIVHLNKMNGALTLARMDSKGLWLDDKLIIEDPDMMLDQSDQATRNVGTAHYQKKYKDFWKVVK